MYLLPIFFSALAIAGAVPQAAVPQAAVFKDAVPPNALPQGAIPPGAIPQTASGGGGGLDMQSSAASCPAASQQLCAIYIGSPENVRFAASGVVIRPEDVQLVDCNNFEERALCARSPNQGAAVSRRAWRYSKSNWSNCIAFTALNSAYQVQLRWLLQQANAPTPPPLLASITLGTCLGLFEYVLYDQLMGYLQGQSEREIAAADDEQDSPKHYIAIAFPEGELLTKPKSLP
ncbi:MAG: hypothetical protein M1825_005824 [Sarcosagium campestre]|nr:MAG: hypothetical protein M1825_005824 [Sarcosagium campestre]